MAVVESAHATPFQSARTDRSHGNYHLNSWRSRSIAEANLDITISPIEESDFDAAASAIASGLVFQRYGMTPASARDVVERASNETVVAWLEGQVAGVAIFWTDGRSPVPAYLRILAVKDGYRGRGVGSALLHYVEARAFARGPNLFLCCEAENHDARRLYEREGYKAVGPLDDLIAPGLHEILYRKTLGPIRDYVPTER